MAQPRPNEMPKIIALLAAISVVLIFAAYQLFGGSRPAENAPNTTGVPAITMATPPSVPTATGTPSSLGTSGVLVNNAQPGQMRQFDDTLDRDPGSTYPPVTSNARSNAFEKYVPPKDRTTIVRNPPPIIVANPNPGGRLPGGNYNSDNITSQPPPDFKTRPIIDNTPRQEITLDGVVTGNDGFAVLTIREPSQQDAAIPNQRRFARVGETVGNTKILEITEYGLKLDKSEGIWSVGDKRGVTRRGALIAVALPSERASMPAMDAKLPMISTP